jgi:hypothetical protein
MATRMSLIQLQPPGLRGRPNLVEHLQAVDAGVYGLPFYSIPARTSETRPRTLSTLSVTMACMDSSTSKA